MRRIFIVAIVSLLTTASFGQSGTIDEMTWVLGTWQGSIGKMKVIEIWTQVNDLTLEGKNFTISGEDTVAFEYMQFHQTGKHLNFIASPGGKAPTLFTLIKAEGSQWIFENKEHDFPQRVAYRLKDSMLIAYIEGPENEEIKRIVFKMVRVE